MTTPLSHPDALRWDGEVERNTPSPDQLRDVARAVGTRTFVYMERELRGNVRRILDAYDDTKLQNPLGVNVAAFCNTNPHLLQIVLETDKRVGLLLQNEEEYRLLEAHGMADPTRLIVSPFVQTAAQRQRWNDRGITVNLSSLQEVWETQRSRPPEESIHIRVDSTPEQMQRMGLKKEDLSLLPELLELERRMNILKALLASRPVGALGPAAVAAENAMKRCLALTGVDDVEIELREQRILDVLSGGIRELMKDAPAAVPCDAKQRRTVAGYQMYYGTGSGLDRMLDAARGTLATSVMFPGVREVNFGGGFAYDYRAATAEDAHFNWSRYCTELETMAKHRRLRPDLRLVLEPGRDVFASAGSYLLGVEPDRVLRRRDGTYDICTDGSYTTMPSAGIQRRQHALRFYAEDMQPLPVAPNGAYGRINGDATLSTDFVVPGDYRLPEYPKDIRYVLIRDVGAYCETQHMAFLNGARPQSVLVGCDDGLRRMTRSVETGAHILKEMQELRGKKTRT